MDEKLALEYYKSSVGYITNDLKNIATNYLRLGFHLWEVDRCKYYEHGGYQNIYEFAETEFGLKRSSVSRCISICRMFSNNGCSMYLEDRYKDYNYSQLCEMLSMTDDQMRKVKPDMTIKQIREIKNCNVIIDSSYNEKESGSPVTVSCDVVMNTVLCDVAQKNLYCRCGAQLNNEWHYCPMCGVKLYAVKTDNTYPGQYDFKEGDLYGKVL